MMLTLITGKLNNSLLAPRGEIAIPRPALSRSPRNRPANSCAPKNSNGGFSLLELIVVCALIGIMLTLAAPTLKDNFFSDPLKSSIRKLIFLTQDGRERAINEQRFCTLRFNGNSRKFTTELHTIDETELTPITIKINDFTMPESVIFDGMDGGNTASLAPDTSELWIGPGGHISPTALHFSNVDGEQMSVHFEPFLIKAKVYDLHTPLAQE